MMKLAQETADLLGLQGEEAEEFIKSAEEKLAGILGAIGKKSTGEGAGRLVRDIFTVGAIGGAAVGMADDTLFGKRRTKRRYGNMMAEAGERGYSDLTDAPDQELVQSAFHIVDSYSPELAKNPILAANATRYILHKGIAGEGGLAPDAIPNMMAAQEALSGVRKPGIRPKDAGQFIDAAGRIIESMG